MYFSLKCSVSKILALVANLKFKIKFVYVCVCGCVCMYVFMYVTFSRARAYIFATFLVVARYARQLQPEKLHSATAPLRVILYS